MKFFVTDEDKKYEVKEIEKVDDEDEIVECASTKDEESLTAKELTALRALAKVADKLVALVSDEESDDEEEEEESIEEVTDDEEELEEKEEVVDTDEDEDKEVKKAKDSKSSFGKIEKPRKVVNDSDDDKQIAIADAWTKRYNGGNK